MKVYGKIIKNRRLNYGLSQYQLAEGICAQATISLIENRNNCPKLEILNHLSHRLNIPIDSIITSTVNGMGIEDVILQGKYKVAEHRLLNISRSKFKEHHHMQRYFCYRGFLSFVNDNNHDALYFFNKVLSQDVNPVDKYCRAWAYLGIGYVYYNYKDRVKSLEFAKLAKRHLNLDVYDKTRHHIKLFVHLRLRLAKLLYQLKAHRMSNRVSFQTIVDLVKVHSMYMLAELYTRISQNYLKLNYMDNAKLARHHAKVFRRIYSNPNSLPRLI